MQDIEVLLVARDINVLLVEHKMSCKWQPRDVDWRLLIVAWHLDSLLQRTSISTLGQPQAP